MAGSARGADAAEQTGTQSSRLRLLPAAVVTWSLTWWACAQPLRVAVAAVVFAVAVAAMTAGLLARPRATTRQRGAAVPVLLAASCAVAGLGATAATTAVRAAGPLPRWAAERAVVSVDGSLLSDPRRLAGGAWDADRERYVLRLAATTVSGRGQDRTAGAPLLLLVGPQWQGLTAGTRVTVTGRLSPAEPGKDVVAVLTVFGAPDEVREGRWWWGIADHVRAGLRRAIEGLPAEPAGLLPSLVVGDTSTLVPEVEQDLMDSGLTHLTAVSGANVAIVAGSVLWVAAALGVRRRWRPVPAAAALAAFVVLARPEPSVVRATAMGAVGLLGLVSSRRARGVPALCTAVVVLLVVDPWLSRSVGFVLSTVATGALLLLAPVWAARLQQRVPRPLALAIAAPAAAQAACGPVVVLLNPTVNLVSVPANLLAEPAVAPATVLGVLAALLALVWPWGAHAVAALATCATWWITQVAAHAAAVPGGSQPWWSGTVGAASLAAATAAVVVLTVRTPRRRSVGVQRVPGRRDAAGGLGVAVGVVLLVLAVLVGWLLGPRVAGWVAGAAHGVPPWSSPPQGWAVALCDVGQGDALVARSGLDRAVLVDVGPDPAAVDRCLTRLGVRHLDLVILTHFHADHVDGLPGALAGRDLSALVVSPLAQPRQNAEAVRRWASGAGVTPQAVWAGTHGEAGADGWHLAWTALLPDRATIPAGQDESATGPAADTSGTRAPVEEVEEAEGAVVNDSSVATLMDIRAPDGSALRLVGLGDLETAAQQHLRELLTDGNLPLGRAGDRPVDVVKVAHHGSATQDVGLYRALGARVALVGVGAGNDYGHPAASTLRMLEGAGAEVRRTDLQGDLLLEAAARPDAQPVRSLSGFAFSSNVFALPSTKRVSPSCANPNRIAYAGICPSCAGCNCSTIPPCSSSTPNTAVSAPAGSLRTSWAMANPDGCRDERSLHSPAITATRLPSRPHTSTPARYEVVNCAWVTAEGSADAACDIRTEVCPSVPATTGNATAATLSRPIAATRALRYARTAIWAAIRASSTAVWIARSASRTAGPKVGPAAAETDWAAVGTGPVTGAIGTGAMTAPDAVVRAPPRRPGSGRGPSATDRVRSSR